jgi:erythromycin esterase-like protein
MRRNAVEYARRDGLLAEDALFYAQQNAQTVRNAEVYYRAMFGGRVTSWNLRDKHMAQTLQALLAHLDRHDGEPARIVLWAHNSHVGDARATEVGSDGQLTLGQLVREHYGEESRLIGFTTYTGTVTAASEWGGLAERKYVRPALNGSVEELFHEVDRPEFLVSSMISHAASEPLDTVRLGRAIGVIYLPATERQSHYYHVRPGDQFDAIIHIDQTRALEPLEVTSQWVAGETPETYPSGL